MQVLIRSAIIRIIGEDKLYDAGKGVEHLTCTTIKVEPDDLRPSAGKTVPTGIVPLCLMFTLGPIGRAANFVNEVLGNRIVY